jgi:hypothetical protein
VRSSISTEKAPVPLALIRSPGSVATVANARRIASMAMRCRSGSNAGAFVSASSSARLARRLPALQHLQQFERRVARQPGLEKRAGRRAEIARTRQQLSMQIVDIEGLPVECVRKQITIGQQILGHAFQRQLAVGDETEALIAGKLRGEGARRIGKHFRSRTLDGHDQHARSGSFADFLDQQFLLRRFRIGQEQAQVRADRQRALHIPARCGQQCRPREQQSNGERRAGDQGRGTWGTGLGAWAGERVTAF